MNREGESQIYGILPRAKKCPPDTFYTSLRTDAALSNSGPPKEAGQHCCPASFGGESGIDAQSRKELTYSKYMQWLKATDPQAYADKLRATDNSGEILMATTDWINEGLNHPRKDKIVQFARGNLLLRVGQNDYTAEVVVATETNGKMKLYDILNLNKTQIVAKEMDAAITENPSPGAGRNTASISDDSVSQQRTEVNEKFVRYSERDSAGNQLSAEQQEYFKDSEARDDGGNLLVLYHQTDGNFTIFDTRHPGAGSRDNGAPFARILLGPGRCTLSAGSADLYHRLYGCGIFDAVDRYGCPGDWSTVYPEESTGSGLIMFKARQRCCLAFCVWKRWMNREGESQIYGILPRAKKCPPDTFYFSLRTGAALSNPGSPKEAGQQCCPASFGGESGIRTHGGLPHHQFSRLAP